MDRERVAVRGEVMLHDHAAASVGFWPLTMMWFGMMAAMMAPTVWPWVRSFHRFNGQDHASSVAMTAQFGAGYLVAWLGYSMAAAVLQLTLKRFGAMDHPMGSLTAHAGTAVFLVAGLYQFAPLKRACLMHCRTPLTYLLTRWRNGPTGGFRMGIGHGVFCVGCCWALMVTSLAVGMMNLWWMAALAAIALLEQVAPHGHKVRVPLGVAMLAAAFWRFSGAS